MACDPVPQGILCRDLSGGGVAWWDMGSGVVWEIPVGTFADWFTALVAMTALVFAARAATSAQSSSNAAIELLRLEQGRSTRAEMEAQEAAFRAARAEQADQVAAWSENSPQVAREAYMDGSGRPRWGIVTNNGSVLPIYQVRVSVVGPMLDQVRASQFYSVVPPGTTRHGFPSIEFEERVYADASGEPESVMEDEGMFDIQIQFTDTAGRHWLRDGDGRLTLEYEEIRASDTAQLAVTERSSRP